MIDEALRQWSARAPAEAEELLEGYRALLTEAGVPANTVRVKYRVLESRAEASRVVASLAVIDEAREGKYSTIVVGRRGTSDVPELFLGGVAEKVSRHVTGATVWIVD